MTVRRSMTRAAFCLAFASMGAGAVLGAIWTATGFNRAWAAASATGASSTPQQLGAATGNSSHPVGFTVNGTFAGLYPGLSGATFTIVATNTAHFNIYIKQVTATVTGVDVGHSACLQNGTPVTIAPWTGTSNALAPNEAVSLSLGISMSASAAQACSGATFALSYGGSAVKA